MTLVIACAAIAAAFPITLTGVARARSASAARQDTVRFLDGGASGPVRVRTLTPAQLRLAGAASSITPGRAKERLARLARLAGGGQPVDHVLAAKGAGLLAGGAIGLWAASAGGAGTVLLPLAPVLGFFGPDVVLRRRARARAEQARLALPDALDLMGMMVEAGVGIEAALARAADDTGGTLGEELARMLREMSLGASRREAFVALRDRVDSPELARFVLAVLQADRLGTPIGAVLRAQAADMRTRRRQQAKERAAKTPVKILFPLVFAIFPALLVVILGPAVIRIMQTVFA